MCVAMDIIMSKDVKSLQVSSCEWVAKRNSIFELCSLKAIFSVDPSQLHPVGKH